MRISSFSSLVAAPVLVLALAGTTAAPALAAQPAGHPAAKASVAATSDKAPPTGSRCDETTFRSHAENVSVRRDVRFNGLATHTTAGRERVRTTEKYSTSIHVDVASTLRAEGEVKLGTSASGIFKKVISAVVSTDVSLKGSIETKLGVEYDARKFVSVKKDVTIPRATTIVIFDGYMVASGKATWVICRPSEVRDNDARIVRTPMRWTSPAIHGEGMQRCDLPARGDVAIAAKKVPGACNRR